MKILQINSVSGVTSTGRIVTDICEGAKAKGHECLIAYGELQYENTGRGIETYVIDSKIDNIYHALYTRAFDKHGLASSGATKRLIKKIENFKPDIIHIHNLHGYYINYEILFGWLKRHDEIKVFWTLHDCWAYTGHCVYYTEAGCERWKDACHTCPKQKDYPQSYIKDNSKDNYLRKNNAFTSLNNLTVIVPSKWLEREVSQSFLKDYEIKVVNNGVDTKDFKPIFSMGAGADNTRVILGVANVWTPNKGLKYYIELANLLKEKGYDNYRICLVGKKYEKTETLPDNVIMMEHTNSKAELNEIYNKAAYYVSFSSEETFGMTIVEAMSAGTYPIVMENTACEEIVRQTVGSVTKRSAAAVLDEIMRLEDLYMKGEEVSADEISGHAQKFSKERFVDEMLKIYETTLRL